MILTRRTRLTLLALANVFIPLACLVFAQGFFPYKPLLPGLATFEEQEAKEELEMLTPWDNGTRQQLQRPMRVFDKVIFMVVDALRSDFVYGRRSGFAFTQSLIRNGNAFPFTAHAAPPTVTMPRVKALTTGSVPSFVDLILNFAESDTSSSLASQDTWLAQIREHMQNGKRGRLHFYGDDTWLKLFPNFFADHDGTSSFFVSDFTEVDNNVTRHLPAILKSDEWDAVVMHYLGLDHIGHKTGPEGPNMLPKQVEMDGIVRQVYTAIETVPTLQDTLFIIAGDHGMNSAGNHGGSGAGETDTALVFMSPKFTATGKESRILAPTDPLPGTEFDYYRKVQQSDLVPTLAALLGLPIPKNNLGIIIDELTGPWKDNDVKGLLNPYLQLLYRNSLQVLEILKSQHGEAGFVKGAGASMQFHKCKLGFNSRVQLGCMWARAQRMILAADVRDQFTVDEQAEALKEFLQEAQDHLSAAASSYDVYRLVAGASIALAATSLVLLATPFSISDGTAVPFFYLLTALYSVMMFATSYVEEEQHIWYWLGSAWIAASALSKAAPPSSITTSHLVPLSTSLVILGLFRLARGWNQTGQKFAGSPDISRTFLPSHLWLLWLAVTSSLVSCGRYISGVALSGLLNNLLAVMVAATIASIVYAFKAGFVAQEAPELVGTMVNQVRVLTSRYDLVFQARLIWTTLAAVTIVIILARSFTFERSGQKKSLATRLAAILPAILITQSRFTNIPLVIIHSAIAHYVARPDVAQHSHRSKSGSTRTGAYASTSLTVLLMSYASYYQFGGSNAISSIDLSNAYNGVSSYNIVAVGVLLFVGNWAGPIWWVTIGVVLLQDTRDAYDDLGGPDRSAVDAAGKGSAVQEDPRRKSSERTEQQSSAAPSAYEVYVALTTLFTAASLTATMVACTLLRTHLFIWTVFSPKYLYAVAWAIGWHGVVNLGWGGLLWLAG